MTLSSLVFGDVFECEGKEYIFLAKSQYAVYAAQILTPQHTQQLETLASQRASQVGDALETNAVYCYVILKTNYYRDRAAHVGRSGSDNYIEYKKLNIAVDLEDQKAILDEIKSKKPISIELKELCDGISLD